MAFTPTTWVDGTTAITATELNRIETGIDDAHAGSIDDASITLAKLVPLIGPGVLGSVDGNSNPTSLITATANGEVLQRSGGELVFAQVPPAATSFLPQLSSTGKIFAGSINLAGTGGTLPSGWSSAATSTGVRTVTHNLGTTAYSITATAASLTGNATFFSKGANSVQLRVHDGSALADAEIDFMLIQYA